MPEVSVHEHIGKELPDLESMSKGVKGKQRHQIRRKGNSLNFEQRKKMYQQKQGDVADEQVLNHFWKKSKTSKERRSIVIILLVAVKGCCHKRNFGI